jgi:hypothetical protein
MPCNHSDNENHHAECARCSSRSRYSEHEHTGRIASQMAAPNAIRSHAFMARQFTLPGLGEGLEDAEIVTWPVNEREMWSPISRWCR